MFNFSNCDFSLSNFLVGFIAGVLSGIFVAASVGWRKQFLLWKEAKRLCGNWKLHNMLNGQTMDPEPHDKTRLTVIEAKPWWRSWWKDSHVLRFTGSYETNEKELVKNYGTLTVDRVDPLQAARTIFVIDRDEMSEERVVYDKDSDRLHVFPILQQSKPSVDYHRHILCRADPKGA